jgi:ribonuclease Y
LQKLEGEANDTITNRAKELIVQAAQRYAASQVAEITTTTVVLPSDEIKGRIIGKEGRNIKALERLTGVEIIVDDTPEAVVLSAFDGVRRHIAKLALEKLIKDGRIQPAKIEEKVEEAQKDIIQEIKQAGEAAAYDVGLVGVDPKLVTVLGRLKFRTSYGQNVLMHSLEVAHIAAGIAAEVGGDVAVAKKAGLFHDIGKALDHQIEGTHVDIGIKVLEKFGVEKEVILAMRSHHEEYPYETLESRIVQTADVISAARPGARKDTVENYLKRLADLEAIASSFLGVEKSYAIAAGRELRVFVKTDEVDDAQTKILARDIANKIQTELKYPGEIKVTVIRETRIIDYAR